MASGLERLVSNGGDGGDGGNGGDGEDGDDGVDGGVDCDCSDKG